MFIFDLSLSIAMESVEDLVVPMGAVLVPEDVVPEDMLPVEEVELFIVPADPLAVPLAPTLAFGFEVLSLLVEGVVEEV